ncbi:MAG: hypothetical protein ACR2RF_25260 [Geminicoccaceae bacterium]
MSEAVVHRFAHDPQGLLEECSTRWRDEKLRAAFVLIVDEQDRLQWDGAAYQRKDLLWAIERFKQELLERD